MITPKTFVLLAIIYILIQGFSYILAGTFKVKRRNRYDELDVVLGILIVIIGILLLIM